ncbi:putative RNase H [Trypanosoma cruzi]|uniref:Putative RNase H n=1 Tax=Trypanosoma cruzi TaxID=5693 RepID=A0A2V2X5K9_TRYCR|nr:putative RNase H [Trypanosoma cruzi]RNC32389.1 L1Tc protein [Trypanosoma cruzi]
MQPHDGVPCTAPGHGKAECPSYPAQAKTLLVVTDSQSLLAAVTKGPHSHTDWTEDRIWQRLLSLMRAGWSVQLQFCYEHRGVHVNEPADQHATQTTATGQYTEQGIAPIRHTDLLSCINTQLTNKWRSTMHQDTHHYLLGGARPSDPGGKHLITQEALDQQERINTAREGCGESELWGRLYWTVRDCTNQRRFRNISPEQSAFMRSNDDPTAPGRKLFPRQQGRPTHRLWRDGPPHGVERRNARTVTPHWWDTRATSVTVGAFTRNALHRFPTSTAIAATRSSPHKKSTAQKSPRTKPRRYSAPQQQCQEAITATAGSASLHKRNN